jgi:nucleoside-diphosphate-sugar epimerase
MLEVAVDEAGRGRVPFTLPASVAKALAAGGEAVSRVIRRPPLVGRGQLVFLLWQARADSTKAREELGIEFTPWEDGIRKTVRWMLDSGLI